MPSTYYTKIIQDRDLIVGRGSVHSSLYTCTHVHMYSVHSSLYICTLFTVRMDKKKQVW